MAKQPAKNLNFSYNSVALEDDMDSATLKIDAERPVITSFADAGPRRSTGNYDWSIDIGGTADFAASQSDATLFAGLTATGAAVAYDPTGAAAGTDDPNYDGTSAVVASYSISSAVGGATKFSASILGNSALARTVA